MARLRSGYDYVIDFDEPRVRRPFARQQAATKLLGHEPDIEAGLHPEESFEKRFTDTRPGLAGTAPVVENRLLHVAHVLDFRYDVEDIDLSIAHTDVPVGLRNIGIRADTLTLTRVDNPISFKVNDQTQKLISASKGLLLSGFDIEEVYVTNAPTSGIAEFFFGYDRRADSGLSPAPFGLY